MPDARLEGVRALPSLPYQQLLQLQTQSPASTLSQYMQTSSHHETPRAPQLLSPTASPIYHSDSSNEGSVHVCHQTQENRGLSSDRRISRTRRRRGASSSSSKRCQIIGCDKISVSRGLCRGHGGGRRCQHIGCSKGAQSRSDFCWAHGGGQRCHVNGCMRSRKSKRYCVAHLNWENSAPASRAPMYPGSHALPCQMELSTLAVPTAVSPASPHQMSGSPRLPSLVHVLRHTQQTPVALQS
ncbi:hypothetical protein PsorP6_019576 [Peronosclerospora sorghi]|nr:hypothetical protein PsorP6_019576 [Peronosclerospora sorghi]